MAPGRIETRVRLRSRYWFGNHRGGRAGCPDGTQPEQFTVSHLFIRPQAQNWQAAYWIYPKGWHRACAASMVAHQLYGCLSFDYITIALRKLEIRQIILEKACGVTHRVTKPAGAFRPRPLVLGTLRPGKRAGEARRPHTARPKGADSTPASAALSLRRYVCVP